LKGGFLKAWLPGVAGALALTLGGCYQGSAHAVSAAELGREAGWELVSGVPFIPQATEHACGVAALAMVFEHWGVGRSEAEGLKGDGDRGVAAGALRDLARAKGLAAFLIQGEEADLVHEVELNRPVLIGVVQLYTGRSASHYEVVTGINRRTHHVLTLDPGRGQREDDLRSFATEWQGAGRLALVVGRN
jgi:ABC-type bacteriocin/lantibiotic exporter with double-glycine peptidase domain